MDLSFLSTHESSMCFGEKTQSFIQNFETDKPFSEYSSIVEYQPNSKIIEISNEFREITKVAAENNNYLSMINNYVGNLSSYLNCVVNNMRLLSYNSDSDLHINSSLVINEIKTWKLIHQLYEDRFNHLLSDTTQSKARPSELDLVRDLYENNTNLRESQVVVDWLEDCLKENLDKNVSFLMGTEGKAWEHTKHTIRRRNNFTSIGSYMRNELDPDAPLRGKLNLSDSDKNDENEYLRYIFHCLQSGDIEKAKILCQNHDEWWRSLSLDGWKPFHNPLMFDGNLENTDVVGNSNRDTFKSVCYQLSQDTQLNLYERAIYATFCGNISVLSLIQKDWSGLMWAYFKSYTEHVVDDYLHTFTINGSFATQSLFGSSDIDLTSLGLLGKSPSSESLAHSSPEQIFHEIASKLVHSPSDIVKTGARPGSKLQISFYRSVFEVVQQFIIVNDIEGLVREIDVVLSHLTSNKSSADKLMLRFLAHVVMFIFSIHVDMPMDVYHKVLVQYIECLIDDHSLENVSFYVSKLSTDLQVKWYCKAMSGVTEPEDKARWVLEALDYDLPVVEISRLVVDAIIQGPDTDKAKISGLDWLTIIPDQYCHLVRQANVLCRTFLANDKVEAAKAVLNKTTKDVIAKLEASAITDLVPHWLRSALYENQCHKAYVAAYEAYVDWHNHVSSQRPEQRHSDTQQDLSRLSFQEKQMLQREYEEYSVSVQQWEKTGVYLGNRVLDSFLATLAMGERGWLSDCECEEAGEVVRGLATKGVVAMTFLAMKVAVTSAAMTHRCFQVTDLVADEALGLYEHFEQVQLHRLLLQVRQCSLGLMAAGDDPLGASGV